MSCPYCGDSKNDKRKARGYVYNRKGILRYYCHNCNIPGITIPKLLQFIDPNIYNEYLREKVMPGRDVNSTNTAAAPISSVSFTKPVFTTAAVLKNLTKISSLKNEHVVKQYVLSRRIPSAYHHKLYLCMKFKSWVNSIKPGQFDSIENDEPRLIIPFADANGSIFAVQGRSFKTKTQLRYITIMLDDTKPKIYGLDTIDVNKKIIAFEGPIDSMFIHNSIATAGSDITVNLCKVYDDIKRFIVVYDNEPRNVHTIKKLETAVRNGFSVCVWPDTIKYKDINDMVLNGLSPSDITKTIKSHTYSGLEALLRINLWKKV